MDTKLTRRLNALNQSIDNKLKRIEGKTSDAKVIKPPRMTQKQGSRHKPEANPLAIAKPAISPEVSAPSPAPAISASIIWSQQGLAQNLSESSALFFTCYQLQEGGGGYAEGSVSNFQKMKTDERCTNNSTVVVQMGDLKTVTGNELIQTSGMWDCSSIVLLTDFNAETRTYGKRSLIHIQGSNFGSLEKPHELADALTGLAKASSVKPKMILATGKLSTAYATQALIIPAKIRSEDGKLRQPLLELMALCDVSILPLTSEITVWPDGSVMTKHDYEILDAWNQIPAA